MRNGSVAAGDVVHARAKLKLFLERQPDERKAAGKLNTISECRVDERSVEQISDRLQPGHCTTDVVKNYEHLRGRVLRNCVPARQTRWANIVTRHLRSLYRIARKTFASAVVGSRIVRL